jgi:hypothetical protein
VFPNPVRSGQDLRLQVRISGCPAEITMIIYTSGFRRVLARTWRAGLSYPEINLDIPAVYLSRLASGTYYYVLILKDCNGTTVRSRLGQLIILR